MRVLFGEGIVKEVENVEVKPLDFGDGKISGTEIDFALTSGDHIKYIYSQNVPIEESGSRAIDFVRKLYEDGKADFTINELISENKDGTTTYKITSGTIDTSGKILNSSEDTMVNPAGMPL